MFEPKVPGFRRVPLNDLAAVAAAITPRTAAVMLEPIQGEAGILPATPEFLHELRTLTRERGILLILDEVQTGIGRTGTHLFDHRHVGITPDIMTLGKGLGGGVPLAALLARDEVACFSHGDQGGTFCGNALTAAIGVAVLRELLKPGFLDAVTAHGQYLEQELSVLARRHTLGAVRGRGLLLGLDLGARNAHELVARAQEAGLLLNAPRQNCLRFMPALNVSRDEIDHMIATLDRLLR